MQFGTVMLSVRAQAPMILVATALSVPLSFGHLYGYEINPSYLLAPLIAWIYFRDFKDPMNLLFMAAAGGGAMSIAIANLIEPGLVFGNTANLILEGLFAPSFLFLGRYLSQRFGYERLCFALAVPSAIFLLACAFPLLLTGDPVRATRLDGTAFIDVHFLGLPVYATFGINSLAPLFCIQTAITAGSFYRAPKLWQAFFAGAMVCGVFLATGNESRSAVLSAMLLIPAALVCLLPKLRLLVAATVTIVFCVATAFALTQFSQPGGRIAESLDTIGSIVSSADGAHADTHSGRDVDALTTGRTQIWEIAAREWLSSPIIGNGYSGFGRFGRDADSLPQEVRENATAHNSYLNALWKGGLLYAIPFFAIIILAYVRALRPWPPMNPQRVFGLFGTAMIFVVSSQFWDILIIPSAGALGWFILGAMGHSTQGTNMAPLGNLLPELNRTKRA